MYFAGGNDVNTRNQIPSEKSDEGHYAVNGTGSGTFVHIDLKERWCSITNRFYSIGLRCDDANSSLFCNPETPLF